MAGSFLADEIVNEYRRAKKMAKRAFSQRKCMKCKNLRTDKCNIYEETADKQFKCDGFEEVENDI